MKSGRAAWDWRVSSRWIEAFVFDCDSIQQKIPISTLATCYWCDMDTFRHSSSPAVMKCYRIVE